jgi:UDPglucose--hexose-1-phosphate uridylyltransferase
LRACPLFKCHEHMTPPEVLRVPAGAVDWRIRVVPNLYAFVGPREGDPPAESASFPATGQHEVIVESGRHDWDIRHASPDEMAEILFAVRERCRAMAAAGPAAIIPFRNYGAAAGNSLIHPHSQLVALDHAPPGLLGRWTRARAHLDEHGVSLFEEFAAGERATGTRVVADTGKVLVFQPRAASVPHETTVLPDDDAADLATASDAAVTAVAGMLPPVLTALAEVLGDPAYNLVVHDGPTGDADARRWYRWHLSLYPRVTTPGGLELATGLAVNPTAPENTAPLLRAALPG